MTDMEVIECFENAWKSLCEQYSECPTENTRNALNMLSKIIGIVKSNVDEKNKSKVLVVDDWNLLWLKIFD